MHACILSLYKKLYVDCINQSTIDYTDWYYYALLGYNGYWWNKGVDASHLYSCSPAKWENGRVLQRWNPALDKSRYQIYGIHTNFMLSNSYYNGLCRWPLNMWMTRVHVSQSEYIQFWLVHTTRKRSLRICKGPLKMKFSRKWSRYKNTNAFFIMHALCVIILYMLIWFNGLCSIVDDTHAFIVL